MAAPKRTPKQRERDRVLIEDMYVNRRLTQTEISRRLNDRPEVDYTLTQQMVGRDLKTIGERWQKDCFKNHEKFVGLELAKLEAIEVQAWDSFLKSSGTHTVRIVKTSAAKDDDKGDGADQETTVRTEELNGDPRFLDIMLKAQQRRAALLGLDRPRELEIPGGGGGFVIKVLAPIEGDQEDARADE